VSPACQSFRTTSRRNQGLVERAAGERAEVVNVARLASLTAGADFLCENFGQRETVNFRRRKRKELEITLLDLRAPFRGQCRRFAVADLNSDLAFATAVPFVSV
jgi:hypothetical protein